MARINWANPLTRGLYDILIPPLAVRWPSLVVAPSTKIGTSEGLAFPLGDASSQVRQSRTGLIVSGQTAFSILVRFNCFSAAIGQFLCGFIPDTGGWGCEIYAINTGPVFRVRITNTAETLHSYESSMAVDYTGKFNTFILTWAIDKEPILQKNGIVQSWSSSSGAIRGTLKGSSTVQFGASSNPLYGNGLLMAYWNRALSSTETAILSNNPWQLFITDPYAMDYDTAITSNINELAPEQTFPEAPTIIQPPSARVNFAYLEVPERLRKSKTGFSIF